MCANIFRLADETPRCSRGDAPPTDDEHLWLERHPTSRGSNFSKLISDFEPSFLKYMAGRRALRPQCARVDITQYGGTGNRQKLAWRRSKQTAQPS